MNLSNLKKIFTGQKRQKNPPKFIYPLLIQETSGSLAIHKISSKEDLESVIGEILRRSDGGHTNIRICEKERQVELKEIWLTTPDVDHIKIWLRQKDNSPDITQFVENLMCEIVDKYERAEVKEIL